MTDDDGTRELPLGRIETTRTQAGVPPPPMVAAGLPASIGRYRVLGRLGEGGMGVVYEAEQASPRRKVAVKVVRGGEFIDESRIQMFRREAETLARLKHPGIGEIYESGRTEDGQHFFAMELVLGRTLDAFLADRPPVASDDELRFRLSLSCKIAEAVQYAHQRGVIHRDLKPTNIIVADPIDDELPTVKILDFGLARITESDTAALTMATEVGVIKGTLPYMSPEQARGNPADVDLRTDVYALGVMLYEMLSNRRPYDLEQKSLVEALRVICEEKVTPLGRTMSGVRRLDPDVETIVGKALEKDVERRYSSAAAFAEDLSRYLGSRPILARPPSAIYQLRKFAGRNRALVGGVGVTLGVLIAGIVTSSALGLRAREQREQALAAQAELETVIGFQSGMLQGLDPEQVGRRLSEDLVRRVGAATDDEPDARIELASFRVFLGQINMTDAARRVIDEDLLEPAVATITERYGNRPLIEARLAGSLTNVYFALGLFDKAEAQLRRAIELYEHELGPGDEKTLSARNGLSQIFDRQGRMKECERNARAVLEDVRRFLGEEHNLTLSATNMVALAYDRQGRFDEALPIYERFYDLARRLKSADDPFTIWALHNLGSTHRRAGRPAEGEPYLVEALERFRRVRGEEHPDTLWAMNSLAWAYWELGRLDEAELLADEFFENRRRVLGEDHLVTIEAQVLLANIYNRQERYAEAESALRAAVDTVRRTVNEEHWLYVWNLGLLAELAARRGDHDEALRLRAELLRLRKRQLGEAHADTFWAVKELATAYADLGRGREAEQLVTEFRDRLRAEVGEDHPQSLASDVLLGVVAQWLDRPDEAETRLREALDRGRRLFGDDHEHVLWAMGNLGRVLTLQERQDEAIDVLEELVERYTRINGPESRNTAWARRSLDEARGGV